jgi:hypothetical protein
MRFERTGARIGRTLPCWFLVERANSVATDGIIFLDPSIRLTNGRAGKWEEDEDKMLKNAVRTYGGKNWKAIALLVRS